MPCLLLCACGPQEASSFDAAFVRPPCDAGACLDAGTHDAGALLPFGAACAKDEECVTGLCFPFNARGPRCTLPCTEDSECPPEAEACAMRGVCRPPL
jgi:hypothetical protein